MSILYDFSILINCTSSRVIYWLANKYSTMQLSLSLQVNSTEFCTDFLLYTSNLVFYDIVHNGILMRNYETNNQLRRILSRTEYFLNRQ